MVEAMAPLRVLAVGPEEQTASIRLLRRFSDQDLTMTDAVGLYLSKALHVGTIWSTDFHLGFTGVPLAIGDG
jgi:hypothetical protein